MPYSLTRTAGLSPTCAPPGRKDDITKRKRSDYGRTNILSLQIFTTLLHRKQTGPLAMLLDRIENAQSCRERSPPIVQPYLRTRPATYRIQKRHQLSPQRLFGLHYWMIHSHTWYR